MKQEKSCGCIVFDGDKILLVKQTQGHWGIPKGHVEKNETEHETAIREVKEETNIDVEIEGDNRYTENYVTDKGVQKEVVYFIAKKVGGSVAAQEAEIKEIEWLNPKDALERVTYDDTRNLLRKALKDKNIIV